MDINDIFAKSTHVECAMCDTRVSVKQLGFDIKVESDVDDAYEFIDCCDDPFLEAVIVSKEALFFDGDEEANSDYWNNHHDDTAAYEYRLDDDFLMYLFDMDVLGASV